MKIITQSAALEFVTPNALQLIERAGRTCYKSEDRITEDSAKAFIKLLKSKEHVSVLEHAIATFRFITDRGVTHEMVRHRLASYSQESTRYVRSAEKIKSKIETNEEVIKNYLAGLSMKQISMKSNGLFSEWEVYKILDENDIERRSLGNTGIINHTYFDKIDTPEKAYLLGMIMADGSVRTGGNQLSITQHKNYSWYLWLMLHNFIRPGVKRNDDKSCHQMTVCSDHLVKALEEKGIIPNKTYNFTKEHADRLWNSVSDEFKHDFLRGYLDGDGSFRFFKQSNVGQTESCNIQWTGPRCLLLLIKKYIFEQYAYDASLQSDSQSSVLFRLTITTPSIGLLVTERMYLNFKFPYGHPKKAARAFEVIPWNKQIAEWGDEKFKIILPVWMYETLVISNWIWMEAMDSAENFYSAALDLGDTPQEARDLLPNSLKTEIVMTANFREWMHFFNLRTSEKAHPQMRELALQAQKLLHEIYPEIF